MTLPDGPQVADFGLARECLRTDAMSRVGSVQWAAPEVRLDQTYSPPYVHLLLVRLTAGGCVFLGAAWPDLLP